MLGLLGRRRQPAVGLCEPGRPQAFAGPLGRGVVPRGAPVGEVLGVGLAREQLARRPPQDVDVALSPTLRHQPSLRQKRSVEPSKQLVVVGDPVKRGGRQDGVHGLRQLELQQVDDAHVGVGS